MRAGALVLLAAMGPASAAEHHYAPAENLEAIDVATIARARHSLDVAAFLLTDVAVSDALVAAGARGVAVRVYLDPREQMHGGPVAAARAQLLGAAGVTVRMKLQGPLMHLKSYCVDGTVLRSGSANFSASGLKHQDNDLSLDAGPEACRGFAAAFERMWGRP